MPKHKIIGALAALSLLAHPGSAVRAHQVEPMAYTMTPSGQMATKRVIVTNTDGAPIDVELTAFSVDVDIDGKRTFTPADNAFLIYPPQATVKPGTAQSFQVRYIGAPNLDKGRLYVVKVSQLNVSYTEKESAAGITSRVGIVLNFNTTVVVQPAKLLASVSVIKPLTTGTDGRQMVTVKNAGDGVADLSTLHWVATYDGKTEAVPPEKLKYGETSMLPPGGSRVVMLDTRLAGRTALSLQSDH